ncbi:MAG: hypothetical protein VX341_12420 [Bdellovibrionota bacterium]|nr:hypothetical protein [Bdellovibrionota bacterium]
MIELSFLKRHDSIKRLIHFGSNGYYPIFDSEVDYTGIAGLKLTKSDKLKAKSLLKKISNHDNIEKQKVLFSSLCVTEKRIVARALMELVEGSLLDANSHLQ